MILPKATFTSLLFLLGGTTMEAQSFLNGDLEGLLPTTMSQLPPNWQAVPWADPVCLAAGVLQDTPDLCSLTEPNALIGVSGNPYSGATFMSGVWGTSGSPNWVFQEGIMQTVPGFTIGSSYTVGFQQAVVKQQGYLDTAGSWIVYLDTVLLGISEITTSFAPFNSASFIWEERSFTFTATATTHTIKFLPWDDDPDGLFPTADTLGALRMGIDAITLTPAVSMTEQGNAPSTVRIFPNPAHDHVSIRCPTNVSIARLEVIDPQGSVAASHRGGLLAPIDVSELLPGLYLLRIFTADGAVFTKRVVKE